MNPPFQPLTLSVEEWQRIWTTQVESRDEGVNRIVKLRAECEAQAQAADSLRLQLRVITEQRDSLVVEQVSLRQRLEDEKVTSRTQADAVTDLLAQLAQAQQELAKESGEYAMDLAVLQDALQREKAATARASQAEAVLKEMRKVLDEHEAWLAGEAARVDSWHSHAGAQLRNALAELQRRRSPTGESK